MKTKLTYKFRLSQKDVQSGLQTHIDELADARKLTEEIKTALTLLAQLRNGNTALLNELFPTICTPKPTPPNTDDINIRLDRIEAKLDKRPVANNKDNSDIPDTRSTGLPAMKPLASGMRGHTVAMPTFADEPADTLIVTAAAYQNTGANFIASFAKL